MKPSYFKAPLLVLVALPTLAHAQSIFHVASTPNEHPTPYQNGLLRVAAAAPGDIWAVGQSAIHFDGTGWTAFPAPLINGDNTSSLNGVAVFSSSDAWAAGNINTGLENPGQVIEHWNGADWSVIHGPPFQSNEQPAIYAMTALSANDIWTVGSLLVDNESLYALFEHWDGTAWKAEAGAFHGFMNAVSADGGDDIWAVGCGNFSEHYDGTSWKLVKTPNVGSGQNCLNGVVALAGNDVWAVGYSTASQTPPPGQYEVPTETLIEHWDWNQLERGAQPQCRPAQPISVQPAARCSRRIADGSLGFWLLLCGQRLQRTKHASTSLGWHKLEPGCLSESVYGSRPNEYSVGRSRDRPRQHMDRRGGGGGYPDAGSPHHRWVIHTAPSFVG